MSEVKTLIAKLLALLKHILPFLPEECSGCGIWTGGKYEDRLIDFRGRRICYWCRSNWSRREGAAGRTLSFDEYMNKATK